MTAMMLQDNGNVVYRSTYQPLTIKEMVDVQVQIDMHNFTETIAECLEKLTWDKLEAVDIPNAVEYLPCIDEDPDESTFPNLVQDLSR